MIQRIVEAWNRPKYLRSAGDEFILGTLSAGILVAICLALMLTVVWLSRGKR